MRNFIFLALAFVAACVEVADETPKSFVRFVAADTTDLRSHIEHALLSAGSEVIPTGSLASVNKKPNTAFADFGWITEQGVIIAYKRKPEVLVIFEPTVAGANVHWKCHVYPQVALPAECGSW